jgi:hypothetical protein
MNVNVVDEPIETIHLYVVREETKQPFPFFPLYIMVACLACMMGGITYLALHPTYEHETLSIPAHFLPLQTFTATQLITPTGIQTYPATTAHGTLTLTNGSIVSQWLPKGFIVIANNGVQAATELALFVPAGNANGYGRATTPAHLLTTGINLSTLSIDEVIGTSLYIRNLDPFTGGRPAYSVKVITPQDKQAAFTTAHTLLAPQAARIRAILAKPCSESVLWGTSVQLSWTCQFVAYPSMPGMQITAIRLRGKNLLVDVTFIAHPRQRWVR